jgi:hypothetical protein
MKSIEIEHQDCLGIGSGHMDDVDGSLTWSKCRKTTQILEGLPHLGHQKSQEMNSNVL